MVNLEQEIKHLITQANLTEQELRWVDEQLVGKKLTQELVYEAKNLIKRVVNSRYPWSQDPDYVRSLHEPLDHEEVKRRVMGDWDMSSPVKLDKKKVVDSKLAPGDAYHHSHTQQSCPHCYSTSGISCLGEIIIDGGSRPALLCGNCNKVFSDVPDGVKILMDAAVSQGAESVGFKAASGDPSAPANAYHDNYETQQTNQKLDQVNSNLNNVVNTIQNLMYQVQELAQQNNKMMEQLANDPLIHMRKTITEFNLK